MLSSELNVAIPSPTHPPVDPDSFVVGCDAAGCWLAVEQHGRGGGLFATREAAWRYALAETDRRAGAVRLVAEPIEVRIG